MDLEFEWDEEKNQINLRKHGINFETAMLVFNDEERIEIYDERHSADEDRYNTIGVVNEVLFVVYTERMTINENNGKATERIRLVSARLANKEERSAYYDKNCYFNQ